MSANTASPGPLPEANHAGSLRDCHLNAFDIVPIIPWLSVVKPSANSHKRCSLASSQLTMFIKNVLLLIRMARRQTSVAVDPRTLARLYRSRTL